MDSFVWDKHITNMLADVQPCLWSNQRHEIGENPDDDYSINIGHDKMDFIADQELFNQNPVLLQGNKLAFNQVNEMAAGIQHELAASPAFDWIHFGSSLDQLQRQEPKKSAAAADIVLPPPNSGTGTTWGGGEANYNLSSPDQLCNNSSSFTNRPYIMNPILSGLIADFGTFNHIEDSASGRFSVESVESLECLLSTTTNSYTDASVEEDDGISLIFSDCRNLLDYHSSYNAVSSGESTENNTAGFKEGNNIDAWQKVQHEAPDEAISKGSSINPCIKNPSNSSNRKEQAKVHYDHDQKVSVNFHSFELVQSDSSTNEGGFRLITENPSKSKKSRLEKQQKTTSNINFQQPNSSSVSCMDEPDTEAIAYMKEMIYRAAAFRPVNLGLEVVEKPKRKNVRISSDPQTVAARQRRERISERIRVLQSLVPGGSKMDTASMLDEAANYLKFLRSQVKALENLGDHNKFDSTTTNLTFSSSPPFNNQTSFPMQNFFPIPKP